MSADGAIPFGVFRSGLLTAFDRVGESREQLCELDAAAGDGDLGTTLAVGFAAAHETVSDLAGQDSGLALKQVGMQLARKAPSTIGTLLAGAFLAAGDKLAGAVQVDGDDIAAMLRSSAVAVATRGRSEAGQRTVLDAMEPAAAEAEEAARDGLGAVEVLERAAAAAEAGAAATAAMEPLHGRAGWIGDRAGGLPDAGAVAWASYLRGLAEGVADATEKSDRTSSRKEFL